MRAAVVICRTALSVVNVAMEIVALVEYGVAAKHKFDNMAFGNAKNVELFLKFGLTKLKKGIRLRVMDSAMNAAI